MNLKNFFPFVLLIVVNIQLLNGQNQSKVYDFPIKPGTQEWQNLKSYEDRLNAYNIPEKLLINMNTQDLVLTCLNYPEFRLIMTRNSLQQGYDYLKTVFNGFGELEKRKDAGMELLIVYQKLNPSDIINYDTPIKRGEFAFNIKYIEILLAQDSILSNLDKNCKKELIKASISNYEAIKEMPAEYASFGLLTPALVLGRLMYKNNHEDFSTKMLENKNLERFVNDSEILDPETLDYILIYSKNYLTQIDNE
ncbi:MAG: hypothetical protein BWY38_03073 [Ignavibacteria bacterium ADurb.Bin266]|nr:MAG: hypothetical protein BWY38_03073 [Ignavibacteria bacterium ADurb.Bin266]